MDIKNRTRAITKQSAVSNLTATMLLASNFCVAKVNGQSAGEGCEGLAPAQNSSQANYLNLYIRDSKKGEINPQNINPQNVGYVCPKVKENLRGTNNVDYWPLDTSFALSINKTANYTVGVQAYSTISISSNDASSEGTDCSGGATAVPVGGIVPKCLGFAAKPNSDGTCPTITANNHVNLTYRLRRFVAIYPPLYDTTGKMLDGKPQTTDTIYVLDRPVSSVSAAAGKPFTMYGPKPCPFAYFDHKGVTRSNAVDYPNDEPLGYDPLELLNGRPSYVATNSSSWSGKNPDGIEFPYLDRYTSEVQSCSSALPLYRESSHTWSIGTVNSGNSTDSMKRVFVRPIEPWAPHYVEDTSFQACAPEPAPQRIDPPLHFARDTDGNIGWCAEVYPTQNPFVGDLDKTNSGKTAYLGYVPPFTSHVVKNSTSPPCTFTSLSTDLDALIPDYAGVDGSGACVASAHNPQTVARHPTNYRVDSTADFARGCYGGRDAGATCQLCSTLTCDRTLQNTGIGWKRFPLLAPPSDVESAIRADIKSYGCLMTYDNNSGKVDTASPKGGCCGPTVRMNTGNGATEALATTGAHLEPGTTCQTPSYE